MSNFALCLLAVLLAWAVFFAAAHPRTLVTLAPHDSSPAPIERSDRLLINRALHLPTINLWAWERPEDLRFLASNQAGIAFLAKTINLQSFATGSPSNSAPSFSVRPRLQPLRFADSTPLIAVVRIENPPQLLPRNLFSQPAALSRNNAATTTKLENLASEISDLQSIPGVRAIQIDFDATTGEHAFYAALLQNVRRKLPASFPLSVTALASWCIGDRWLAQLPPGTIDEAVPMLFRMGPGAADVARFLHSGNEFPVAACRSSLGLSTDEPLLRNLLNSNRPRSPLNLRNKRLYIFAPRSWTSSFASEILKELQP
ncbi:MAG: DUF3142 domain-containing protein [Candidatus Acidiferrum sp.]